MKKFYIVDENGTYASADGKTHFTCLTGKDLFDYLNSEVGSKKEFYVDFDDNGDEIGVEVPEDKLEEHLKEKEHRKYLNKVQKEVGYTIVSLNADFDGKDGEQMTYEEVIADEDSLDFMEEISRKADIQTLRKALASLTVDEMAIISALYLADKPMTECELAEDRGVTQQAIHKRKVFILNKLRNFFEI